MLGRCDELYRLGGPEVRRLSNQFLFEKLEIDVEDDGLARVTRADLREPFATIHRLTADTKNLGHLFDDRGSKDNYLVPPAGFEPATHGLGNRRSIP
ncbi:MAG: hypothetical protein QOH03_4565 [Kribbellaceae bacterium]|nr:hypothetical protein [Kribbellaceae bacterium]